MKAAAEFMFEDELIVSPDLQPVVDRLRKRGLDRKSILALISDDLIAETEVPRSRRTKSSVVVRHRRSKAARSSD